jgi:hypothetical protein
MLKRFLLFFMLFACTGSIHAMTPLQRAVLDDNLDLVNNLLANGAADPCERKNFDQKTPLHIAARKGNLAILQALLAYGAKVDARDGYDATPLHDAAEMGHLPIILELLRNHADVNAQDKDGDTPLILATLSSCDIKGYNLACIQALLNASTIDVTIKTEAGKTSWDIATGCYSLPNETVAQMIREHINRKKLLALAQARHPRLGATSSANTLTDDALQLIFQFLNSIQEKP